MIRAALARCTGHDLRSLDRFAQAADLHPEVAAYWRALTAWERARRSAGAVGGAWVGQEPSVVGAARHEAVLAAAALSGYFVATYHTDNRMVDLLHVLANPPAPLPEDSPLRAALEAAFGGPTP